jgi:hypothetical protein
MRCRTASKKQRLIMNDLCRWIKQIRSQRLGEFMPMLKRKLVGIANYFGLPDNSRSLTHMF